MPTCWFPVAGSHQPEPSDVHYIQHGKAYEATYRRPPSLSAAAARRAHTAGVGPRFSQPVSETLVRHIFIC